MKKIILIALSIGLIFTAQGMHKKKYYAKPMHPVKRAMMHVQGAGEMVLGIPVALGILMASGFAGNVVLQSKVHGLIGVGAFYGSIGAGFFGGLFGGLHLIDKGVRDWNSASRGIEYAIKRDDE